MTTEQTRTTYTFSTYSQPTAEEDRKTLNHIYTVLGIAVIRQDWDMVSRLWEKVQATLENQEV